jgi:hypothetical protein
MKGGAIGQRPFVDKIWVRRRGCTISHKFDSDALGADVGDFAEHGLDLIFCHAAGNRAGCEINERRNNLGVIGIGNVGFSH